MIRIQPDEYDGRWVETQLQDLHQRLVHEFGDLVPEMLLLDIVEQAHRRYASATIHQFVPLFVERDVRRVLTPPAQRHAA